MSIRDIFKSMRQASREYNPPSWSDFEPVEFLIHLFLFIISAPALAATFLWTSQAWQWLRTANWPTKTASQYVDGSLFKFEGLIGWNNIVDGTLAISAVKFGFLVSAIAWGATFVILISERKE